MKFEITRSVEDFRKIAEIIEIANKSCEPVIFNRSYISMCYTQSTKKLAINAETTDEETLRELTGIVEACVEEFSTQIQRLFEFNRAMTGR